VHPTAEVDGPVTTLDPADEISGQLVFLVKDQVGDRLEVYLPVRPNGSTGWVVRDDVELSRHRYRIEVSLGRHRLRLTHGSETLLDVRVGVGAAGMRTPTGVYYLKELLRPPDPSGVYGPYAYGLSGYSTVFTEFAGGDGVIGLHGTDDPSSIGQDVSHGCIRLANDVIVRMVEDIGLPLGTPVTITD
jgi:lipoprotein-anchoring transpeptidase ErfK/SrfK